MLRGHNAGGEIVTTDRATECLRCAHSRPSRLAAFGQSNFTLEQLIAEYEGFLYMATPAQIARLVATDIDNEAPLACTSACALVARCFADRSISHSQTRLFALPAGAIEFSMTV